MSKLNFKDYAGYYIGCKCLNTWFPEGDKPREYNWVLAGFRTDSEKHYLLENDSHFTWTDSIKPILRRMGDWVGNEISVYNTLVGRTTDGVHSVLIPYNTPQSFHWLLKQDFDLFGLIDAGLALDSKTIK
jgi:hypothetical protein